MTSRPQTSAEFDLLTADASRGIFYPSFQDFWNQRLEPLQFIPADATGVLAATREAIQDHARAQWALFELHRKNSLAVLRPTPMVAVDVS